LKSIGYGISLSVAQSEKIIEIGFEKEPSCQFYLDTKGIFLTAVLPNWRFESSSRNRNWSIFRKYRTFQFVYLRRAIKCLKIEFTDPLTKLPCFVPTSKEKNELSNERYVEKEF